MVHGWGWIVGLAAVAFALTGCGEEKVFDLGDKLTGITVKDCDNNDVSLEASCGADALFIFVAHGWCPLCKRVSKDAEAIHDSFAGTTLVSFNIVVETGLGDVPDAHYCKLWRDTNKQEDVITLYDPEGTVLSLWPEDTSSLSAYVDESCAIKSRLSHNGDIEVIKAEIQKTLGE